MVSIKCIVWCLLLVYGVSCESPTPSPNQQFIESADLGPEFVNPEVLSANRYYLSPADEPEWATYSPEVYPLFKRAVKELASSEHGIAVFYDSLNRPNHPRDLFEQVFAAYNNLATEDSSSSATDESQGTTMYHLATTDPRGSEVVSDAFTVEDGTTRVHHTTASHEGDGAAMYYTTEGPVLGSMIESMLSDEAFYARPASSEDQEDASVEVEDGYVTSADAYEAISQDEGLGDEEFGVDASESADAASESELEDIVRRSGALVEEHSSPEHAHCEGCPLQVGSIRGIPGEHFPNYDEIPITSFSCADKHVPGFYADLETGCQVFHVCWPHRRESFLCPIGTLFNQAILACDYWYSTDCSLASLFFDVTTLSPKSTSPANEKPTPTRFPTSQYSTERSTTESYFVEKPTEVPDEHPHVDLDWFRVGKFLPVKSKVTVYSKHSSKKPGSKWVVKQKHDVFPLVEEFLALTKNIAENAIRLVPKMKAVVKPISKSELVKDKPSAKLEPCLKIKDLKIKHQKPTPPVVKKPQPLPKLDPRFIVKPVVAEKPLVYVKKERFVLPKVAMKQVKPLDIKASKHHAPDIVMKALKVAGNVLQRDILDLARQALVESHIGSLNTKQ